MLCLNKLGIGGVETAALNQLIELSNRGFKVVVLAKDGLYRTEFEKYGAIFEEFEFTVGNKYDLEKINRVMKILEKYDVEQVHIHQFDCINTMFPACIIKNIPYVAYTHTGILGVYDWFENSYVCYKNMFKLYFKCAEKIVSITEQAKKENQNKYEIDDNKYIVIKNSINFNDNSLKETYIPEKIEKFLIVSRFSNEKMISIKNSILIFKEYYKINPNARLTIVGNGECKETIEKEIKDIKQAVDFLGERNDVMKIIAKNDVILALDRCVLEAVVMKKIAVISGYDDIKGIVTPEIIEKVSDNNFSGRNIETQKIENVIKFLSELKPEKIKEIVEKNYNFAYENLNSSKNIYVIENTDNSKSNLNPIDAMSEIIELQNLYAEHIKYTNNLYAECKKTQKWLEDKIDNHDKENLEKLNQKQIEIDNLKKEINNIYQSKTWKVAEKMRKMIKGK